jgi:hypothetical protein
MNKRRQQKRKQGLTDSDTDREYGKSVEPDREHHDIYSYVRVAAPTDVVLYFPPFAALGFSPNARRPPTSRQPSDEAHRLVRLPVHQHGVVVVFITILLLLVLLFGTDEAHRSLD